MEKYNNRPANKISTRTREYDEKIRVFCNTLDEIKLVNETAFLASKSII